MVDVPSYPTYLWRNSKAWYDRFIMGTRTTKKKGVTQTVQSAPLPAHGTLEVVAGPMFSGKTEYLLFRVRKERSVGRKVFVVTHAMDKRYAPKHIVTHKGDNIPASAVHDADEITSVVPLDTELIVIEEVQFFGSHIIPVVRQLLRTGHSVIAAGLALDRSGKPFHPVPALMAEADSVIKLTSMCSVCGLPAVYHRRTTKEKRGAQRLDPSLVGAAKDYAPFCRTCVPRKK